MDKIEGFDWDVANVDHVGHYAVTPFEVEEVVDRAYVIIPAKIVKGESRWKLFGKTGSGCYLVVVFTVRRRLFRSVTAYAMSATEEKLCPAN